jgi:hypothetical protein
MHTLIIFICKWKEGEIGKQLERQRKRECECVSIAGRQTLVSIIKLAVGKTHWPVFGISYPGLLFLGNYFNGRVG